VSKKRKRLETIRNNPKGVRFADLVALLISVGFVAVRQAGSHAIYQHPDLPAELINLQSTKDGNAKVYQVEQVLAVIDKWNLEVL
jgi:predicted RNA binding protein YcfA (HicA-like mRNA interferase family)